MSFDEAVVIGIEHEAKTRGPRFSTLDDQRRFFDELVGQEVVDFPVCPPL